MFAFSALNRSTTSSSLCFAFSARRFDARQLTDVSVGSCGRAKRLQRQGNGRRVWQPWTAGRIDGAEDVAPLLHGAAHALHIRARVDIPGQDVCADAFEVPLRGLVEREVVLVFGMVGGMRMPAVD